MNKSSYKVAIVSDLHCLYRGEKTPSGISHLYTNTPMKPIARHPVYALLDLLEKNPSIRADMLICPGDIADKADEQGLVSGWEFLKKIRNGLDAEHLLSTIGNHDVDSRNNFKYPSGPFEMVRSFVNDFPVPKENEQVKYWSKHFVIIESNEAQVLIINTCHNHISEDGARESIITTDTLDEIKKEVERLTEKDFRFAFCHHHPVKHSNIDLKYKDGDVIENGDKLLQLLSELRFQIVVHGHKHDPRIKLEHRLTVFAAGSFSSLQNIKELGGDNCFHIVELFPNKRYGVIKTWIYAPTRGWEQRSDREFPCETGFGSEKTAEELAEKFHDYYIKNNNPIVKFSEVVSIYPDVRYLIPEEQKNLNYILKSKYNLSFVPELPDVPKLLIDLTNE